MLKKIYVLFFIFTFSVVFAQSQASDFVLNDIDGNEIQLSEVLSQGPVFINFWATWCKPCRQEMDEIQKLYTKYHDKGIQFIAISVDAEKSVSRVKPFIKSKDYPFIILLDTNGDVARDYYAQAVPFSVLINKKGEIVYTNLGYKKGDELKLEKYLKQVIN